MIYNKRIIYLLIIMSGLYLLLISYLTYFQLTKARELSKSAQNPRVYERENKIRRGSIYDRSGVLLAETVDKKRVYPYNSLYAHVIGYSSLEYGKTGLESTFNGHLLAEGYVRGMISDFFNKTERAGASLTLTIDHNLQQKAKELLGNRNGSIIALEPKTGACLAFYGNPSFDPNPDALKANWEELTKGEGGQLLSRPAFGLYAPGSVFKPIMAAAAYESGLSDMTFDDGGEINMYGYNIVNFDGKANGLIGLKTALTVSSNVYFCKLADMMGEPRIQDFAERFGFNRGIEFDIPISRSGIFKSEGQDPKTRLAVTGMGQGDVLATPFMMAMVISGFANNGTIMMPYLVDRAEMDGGTVTYRHRAVEFSSAVRLDTASFVNDMMLNTVNSGTGTGAKVPGVSVAGKTGTAENERDKDHAWFIGFAPYENPSIAVCVMLEYEGRTGGAAAAPVAREVVREYLR